MAEGSSEQPGYPSYSLEYREFVGDDEHLEGTRPFPDLLAASDAEAIVFGWVVFASREARDEINALVAADPRMADLIDAPRIGFDASRMAYGGFRSLVEATAEEPRGT